MKSSNQTEFYALVILILAVAVYIVSYHPELFDQVMRFLASL